MRICQCAWGRWRRFTGDYVGFFAGGVKRYLQHPPQTRITLLPGGDLLQSVWEVSRWPVMKWRGPSCAGERREGRRGNEKY